MLYLQLRMLFQSVLAKKGWQQRPSNVSLSFWPHSKLWIRSRNSLLTFGSSGNFKNRCSKKKKKNYFLSSDSVYVLKQRENFSYISSFRSFFKIKFCALITLDQRHAPEISGLHTSIGLVLLLGFNVLRGLTCSSPLPSSLTDTHLSLSLLSNSD